jgi:hypothetical protein
MRWYKRRMFGTGSVVHEVIRTFEQQFEASGRPHEMLLVAECRDPVDWIVWMRIPDTRCPTKFLWFEAADENKLPHELKKLGGSDSDFESLLRCLAAKEY